MEGTAWRGYTLETFQERLRFQSIEKYSIVVEEHSRSTLPIYTYPPLAEANTTFGNATERSGIIVHYSVLANSVCNRPTSRTHRPPLRGALTKAVLRRAVEVRGSIDSYTLVVAGLFCVAISKDKRSDRQSKQRYYNNSENQSFTTLPTRHQRLPYHTSLTCPRSYIFSHPILRARRSWLT